MSSDLVIRPARVSDAEALAAIWHDLGWLAWHRLAGLDGLTKTAAAQLELALASPEHAVIAAAPENGPAVGYAALHRVTMLGLPEPEAYLSELFVARSHRGQGVGGRLLDAAEERARQWGVSRMLLLNGRDRQSYQRGFYAARGYQERPGLANFVKPLLEL